MNPVLNRIKRLLGGCFHLLRHHIVCWTRPPQSSLVLGTMADLARTKSAVLAENALLRQQLIILRRQVKGPVFKKTDRMLLVLLVRATRTWRQALFIVQPETLLRWHREAFRLYWKKQSKAASIKPKMSMETISLIKEMAANNRLWGLSGFVVNY